MILSIHQPSYFPWLGLLHKIANSDVYMIMDEVQLSDSAYQHRNIFLTADGKVKFLTIPFNKKQYQHRPFKNLEITDNQWQKNHLNFVRNTYKKHPYSSEVMPLLEEYLSRPFETLCDAVIASMELSMNWFGIDTNVIRQSAMEYDRSLNRGDLVMALIRAAAADEYLSGTGAQAYLDESQFGEDIKLTYNNFSHPTYPQKGITEFIPGLSCVDIVFNLGLTGAKELLQSVRNNK